MSSSDNTMRTYNEQCKIIEEPYMEMEYYVYCMFFQDWSFCISYHLSRKPPYLRRLFDILNDLQLSFTNYLRIYYVLCCILKRLEYYWNRERKDDTFSPAFPTAGEWLYSGKPLFARVQTLNNIRFNRCWALASFSKRTLPVRCSSQGFPDCKFDWKREETQWTECKISDVKW